MAIEVPPELASKFEVAGILGEGGMGVVYRARQPLIDREIALKLLAPAAAGDEFTERFRQEAVLASKLIHPNVVLLFEFGFAGTTPYMVFELVEGRSVRALLKQGVPPVELALDIASQTCAGLTAAHAKGIVHRDLKPENLLVAQDGIVKIADFGIAKAPLADEQTGLTQTGVLLGTPSYMAPEQGRGSKVGPAADIYALGVVLYELLAGHVPFRGQTVIETLKLHAEQPPPPLRAVHPALRTLVTKALAKQPQDRFRSAAAFQEELDHVAQVLGHDESLRHHTMTREFAAEVRGAPGPTGTMVSAVAPGEVLHRSRREVTPVAARASEPPRTEEGGGVGYFLLLLAAAGMGAFAMSGGKPADTPPVSAAGADRLPHGFGRMLRPTGLAAMSYGRKTDRVRQLLAMVLTPHGAEAAHAFDGLRGEEKDGATAALAGCLGLALSGLEESARTDFNSSAAQDAADGQLPAAWLMLNATLEVIAAHQLEPGAATAAAEEQEAKRGSALRHFLRGLALLKRATPNPDGAAKAFLDFGFHAIGHNPPFNAVWENGGPPDATEASSAWFFLGVAQVLACEHAPDPAPGLRNAAGSFVRYLVGLADLPCAPAARDLLGRLESAGFAPRGLPVPPGRYEPASGAALGRLVYSARSAIDRAAAAKRK